MKKGCQKYVCMSLATLLLLGTAPVAALAEDGFQEIMPVYQEIMPVQEEIMPVQGGMVTDGDVCYFAGGTAEALENISIGGILYINIPNAAGIRLAKATFDLEALAESKALQVLRVSAFGTEIDVPIAAINRISKRAESIQFTFTADGFSFMILDADGDEYVWRDGTNHISVSMAFRVPMDISTHQIVLMHQESGAVARSFYKDGKVYAKLNQSGEYTASIESIGGYTDTAQKWMHTAAGYMTARGVVSGSDGLFNPGRQVSRAEFQSMLFRTLCTAPPIDDNANEMITRQEMIFMAYRAMEVCGMLPQVMTEQWIMFDDWEGNVLPAYSNAIQALCKMNIISGTGNGRLNPNGIATRAEAVQILYNILMYDKAR